MGANKIIICHWDGSSSWETIEVNHNALEGHQNHFDIWPPVEGVTNGNNWPRGEEVYLNGCVLEVTATPSPEPTPSPTSSLPDTGAGTGGAGIVAALLIAVGTILWRKGSQARRETQERKKKGPRPTSYGPKDWGG